MKLTLLLLCLSVAGAWVGPSGWFTDGPRFTGLKSVAERLVLKFNPQPRFLEWTSAMSDSSAFNAADGEDPIGDALVELLGPKKPAPAPTTKLAAATKPASEVATSLTVARADPQTKARADKAAQAAAVAKTEAVLKIAAELHASMRWHGGRRPS